MDSESSRQLFEALRDCGLYPDNAVKAAETVLATGGDDAAVVDQLFNLGVLTPYQNRKLRLGRVGELLFGPFLVLDKIGEGGMGKVYRACQVRIGRIVALKVVRAQLMADKVVLNRFKREAAAAAALDHPNVVKLYGADEVNGRYYMEMEFIDGIDLSRMVKEFGKPPKMGLTHFSEACEYVRQAALGLQHAHDNRLVHRDIKPSNLLVCGHRALPGTDGKAVVKILDMGLVRSLVDDEDDFRTDLTRDGTVVGTPDYMAPEQAKNSKKVDARADLYSLGCTLYYLLKGQPPFPDGNPIEKLLKHQVDKAPDLRQARPDVPADLAAVVERLMEKDPADRYQTAAAVAAALAPFSGAAGASYVPPKSGRVSSAYEPFSFTDDAVAPPPSPPPAENPATTAVLHPPAAPTLPNQPQSGGVRLRVVRPGEPPPAGAARSVAVPRAVSAVPVARSDAPTPTSGSLSGGSRGTPKSATKSDSDTPATPTRARPRKPPPKKKPRRGPVVFAAGGALLLLAAAGVALALGLFKGKAAPPAPGAGDRPAARNNPRAPRLLPVQDVLPARTTAVLVAYPKPYWQQVTYNPAGHERTTERVRLLAELSRFDLRTYDRGTLAFLDTPNHWIAVGEGPFLAPAWAAKLDEIKDVKSSQHHGQKVYSFPLGADGPYHAAVLGRRAYGLSNDPDALGRLGSDLSAARAAGDQLPGLVDALKITDPAANPPFLTFAATGAWALPDGTTLGDHGVSKAVVTARLAGDVLDTTFVFQGGKPIQLQTFVNDYLTLHLPELYPGLKPVTNLVAPLDRVPGDGGSDGPTLTLTVQIPLAAAAECLDNMLALGGEKKK